jgi:outer membrane biosynthesis protein TonB
MCFFRKRKQAKLAKEAEAKKAAEAKVEPQPEVKKVEPKPAPEKVEAKPEPKKVEPKPAPKKVEPKKVEPKPAPKKVEAPKEEPKESAKAPKYHVSQNKDEKSEFFNQWRVRKSGSSKTIKYFRTQKEAIDYAKGLAKNAETDIVIHKTDGKIRKQKY